MDSRAIPLWQCIRKRTETRISIPSSQDKPRERDHWYSVCQTPTTGETVTLICARMWSIKGSSTLHLGDSIKIMVCKLLKRMTPYNRNQENMVKLRWP